ncbi:MAG: formate dehydrogenase accessory sulfurtransferase FdhD, partial [Rhodobacterales bacterium]|nr:formate dehydrogenase accessory sulfurtransferase FdhD [Rhodobacterales bacterium]
FGPGGPDPGARVLAAEVAVAISVNGTTQAVMMATPADLEDFARGFALTEGLAKPDQILSVEVAPAGPGIDLQLWLAEPAAARLAARRRRMAGPVGCGLCGIETIEQALAEPPALPPGPLRLTPAQVMAAVAALPGGQALHDRTRAVHAAAFWAGGRILATREDVGRHNALDKLAGWAVRQGAPVADGAVVMTSRVSIDLVQKVARLGAGVLIAVSAPTVAAVDLADRLGVTLICNARPDRFDLYSHSDRITTEVQDAG